MKKRMLFAALTGALLVSPAMAADLPMKAPALRAPVYNWTGFYLGVNAGYGIGADTVTETTVAGAGTIIAAPGTMLYGGPATYDLGRRGWNGGAQIGYNVQFSPMWVAGLEADFQGADINRTHDCVLPCNTPLPIIGGPAGALFPANFTSNSYTQQIDWFGTARARLGFTTGPTLFYATGGLAYGDVKRSGAVNGFTTFLGGPVNTFAGSFSASDVKFGWTVGAGLEAQLWGGLSMKAEYLYVDLGSVTDNFNTVYASSNFGQTGLTAANRSITSDVKEHIFRLGVNYKLGGLGTY